MSIPRFDIISYSEDWAGRLLEFERGIVQGKNVKLEIIKEHFLDRARVFQNFHALVALSDGKETVGTLIGAETIFEVNGERLNTGFAFDAKVTARLRKRGIGRQLAKELYSSFFKPAGLKQNFMTVKKANAPVWMLLSKLLSKVWIFDFVYLTIPSSARLKHPPDRSRDTIDFGVKLFEPEKLSCDYYTACGEGLGYLHSYQLYRLKITKIHPVLKLSIAFLAKLHPQKYKNVPREGEIMSFVTLYGHTPKNINSINSILEEIGKRGIGQLLVCCRKNDYIYHTLKHVAINNYSYCIVSDFPVGENDRIFIDARCL